MKKIWFFLVTIFFFGCSKEKVADVTILSYPYELTFVRNSDSVKVYAIDVVDIETKNIILGVELFKDNDDWKKYRPADTLKILKYKSGDDHYTWRVIGEHRPFK